VKTWNQVYFDPATIAANLTRTRAGRDTADK